MIVAHENPPDARGCGAGLAKELTSRLDFRHGMKFVVQKDAEPIRATDEQFYLILLGLLAAAMAAIVTSFALALHHNFLTIACDTAAVHNALVNTLHGNWFRETAYDGPNLLAMHSAFTLLLLLPVYAIFPSADTLFTLQVWGVFSTVIPIYLVAQDLLRRPKLAFCLAAGALISPLFLSMAVAPFHLETWIVAAAFWAYHFYRRHNLIGFSVSLLVAFSCGEQAALIFISLGASMLLVNDGLTWRRQFGALSFCAGVAWILLAIFIVEPIAGHGSDAFNIFAYNYAQWNVKSFSELPLAVVQQPGLAVGYLLNISRWQHLAITIGLPLACGLLSWRSLILLAPFPVYFLMSNQEFFLYFHAYYFSFALVAGMLGLLFFLARNNVSERFGIALVAITVFTNVLLLCTTASYYIEMTQCRDDAFTGMLRQAFAEIPVEATVYGPHRYSAYLSNRQNMVIGDLKDENLSFDVMMEERYRQTNVRPSQVDYIVVDCITDQCGCRDGGYDAAASQHRSANINSLLQSGSWKMVFNQKNTVILQRAN